MIKEFVFKMQIHFLMPDDWNAFDAPTAENISELPFYKKLIISDQNPLGLRFPSNRSCVYQAPAKEPAETFDPVRPIGGENIDDFMHPGLLTGSVWCSK